MTPARWIYVVVGVYWTAIVVALATVPVYWADDWVQTATDFVRFVTAIR